MKYVSSVSEFNQALTDSGIKPVIIDFYANWCGPCKMIAPLFEELSKKYDSAITFLKINVEDDGGISDKYDVNSLPTFMVFWNKEPTKILTGANPKALEKLVESLL